MKKFTALFALAAIALLVASPAAAFNTSVTNVLDSSWVGAFAKWKLKVNMTTFNDAAVTTYVDSKSETGDNKIESNDDGISDWSRSKKILTELLCKKLMGCLICLFHTRKQFPRRCGAAATLTLAIMGTLFLSICLVKNDLISQNQFG